MTKPTRLATNMNEFFTNKFIQLRQHIPAAIFDPLSKLQEVMSDSQCSLSFRAIPPSEVSEIIAGLKNSKSTDMDYIDTWVVKLVSAEILPAITHIMNISITHSVFPLPWKVAKIIPLLTKGDSLLAKNYRPVALLPIFSKILERAVFLQIAEYLESNHLLNSNHQWVLQRA